MEQDQLRSRARLGSLAARTAQPSTSMMSGKKGKQNSSQADQKKHVRLQETVGEDEIISQLTHLDLDKDRLVAGTALIYDTEMTEPKCLWDSKNPESPERVIAVMEAIEKYGLLERCKLIPPRLATKEELMMVHSPDYLELIKSSENMNTAELRVLSDSYDLVYFHPKSYNSCCMAVGCVLQLVDQLMLGKVRNGLAVVRPPGHQALKDTANSYCIFNTLAIAATYARRVHGVNRIMMVDWDIYHGQGTQYIFEDDPRVLLFSIHRYEHGDFWPHLAESDCTATGTGNGKGYNINIPWNKTGMSDADYFAAFHKLLLPIAHEYRPNLILVAAGFNSVLGDPQGKMTATPAGFAQLTHMLMPLAAGRLLLSLEGGFNLRSMADATSACLKVLLGDPCPPLISAAAPCQSALESISAVISVHRKYWKCLQNRELSSWRETQQAGEGAEPRTFVDKTLDLVMAEVMRPLPTHQTGLLYDERMKEHYNMWDFQHPEQPKRISRIFARHQELNLVERCQLIPAQRATESQLQLCHGEKYIEILKSTTAMKPQELHRQSCEYNSIFIAPQSYESALLAVGSTFSVVEAVLNDEVQNGVAIVRPPGHHAEKDKACGFCFFNNVALAARFAQNTTGRKMKVLILDWDVHHGNGTQHMFESDPSVLYISLHRYDQNSFFPNSEDANYDKVGIDAGEGFNVNIPWNGSRMGDSEYMAAFHRVVMPISYQFQPDLVLVSAGFDAARGDPLGGCLVSPECYAHMTHMLLGLAGGRVVLVLEGGYNLSAISESMAMCTRTLLGDTPPYLEQLKLLIPSAALAISNVITTHRKYWSCLRLLAAELELQIQPMMTRTWGQQPVSSQAAVPLVEPRVQASQSRRTSMWLQQQAPTQVPAVTIMDSDTQLAQSRRTSMWSQQQVTFQPLFIDPDLEADTWQSESQRGSLWSQQEQTANFYDYDIDSPSQRVSLWSQLPPPSQLPQLDASGQPLLITPMPLWPRPPPSPLAILPMKQEEDSDDPASLRPTTDSQVDSSQSKTPSYGPSKPKGKAGLEQGPRALTKDRFSERMEMREEHSSQEMISSPSSIFKLPGSSEDELSSLSGDNASRWCPEVKGPLPLMASSSRILSAVTPLTWCPHLDVVRPRSKPALNVNQPCQECGSEGENWVCLTCFQVYCGRYVNEHMLVHGLKHKHLLVLSYVDLSVWCYGCDSYVHNEILLPFKKEVHRLKFGEELD